VDQEIRYTGAELRSHWIRERFGLIGDAGVAFIGPCDVMPEHMIDLDERINHLRIAGDRMLHCLIEHFQVGLREITLRQRLLAGLAFESLVQALPGRSASIRRRGDDLYVDERKLSISIATVSPLSGLIHFAVNCVPAGVPVPAASLEELGQEPQAWGVSLLARYAEEMEGVSSAMVKVRPAR
jgi:hypothetical protein